MRSWLVPLALALSCACGGSAEMRAWAADRGAGELLLLDRELGVARRVPVSSPRALARGADGLWVAAAAADSDELATRLVHLEPERDDLRALEFEALVALCAEESGDALVVERAGGSTRLWRVDSGLARTLLGRFPAASALAERGGEVLIGGSNGALVRATETGGMDAAGHWDGPVSALAPGPRAGEWWVLGANPAGVATLGLIDSELEPRWAVETGLATRAFAPVPGAERVWVADGRRARCYGPGGALEHEHALDLAETRWRAATADEHRVVLFAEGALLELGLAGGVVKPRRSQGGFRALSAFVAAGS